MNLKTIFPSGSSAIVMIGAGLSAALLFSVARQGTLQAAALAYVTPLPIMISTLGFGPVSGFVSALVATLTIAALSLSHKGATVEPLLAALANGGIFLLVQALPAWWLAYLASLSKLGEGARWQLPKGEKLGTARVYYPVGHLLVHIAAIVILLMAFAMAAISIHFGTLGHALDKLTQDAMPVVSNLVSTRPELENLDPKYLTQLVLKSIPALIAAWSFVMFAVNLWLAGRIVQISNILPRPWPPIARELRLPRLLLVAFAVSLGLCAVPGWGRLIGSICAVTLCVAYAFQGIAVLHELSRQSQWRIFLLFSLYAVVVLFMPWSLVLFALVALADSIFSFRDRKAVAAVPKS